MNFRILNVDGHQILLQREVGEKESDWQVVIRMYVTENLPFDEWLFFDSIQEATDWIKNYEPQDALSFIRDALDWLAEKGIRAGESFAKSSP